MKTLRYDTFTGLVLLTLFLQDMLSLALPCILIMVSKAVSFSKFPMNSPPYPFVDFPHFQYVPLHKDTECEAN